MPELLGDDLGEGRLVALALGLDAELEHRLAGGMDAELGRVEHPQPGDVVLLAVPRADHLGEGGEADPEQPPFLARRGLLEPELLVAELLERDPHRLGVVAGVVDEAGGGLVRELLRLDEVVEPEPGSVDLELVGGVVDEPLDQVRGLGDPERAPVGDAAGCLVRVPAVRDDVRGRDVVRAGNDVEQAGAELRRLRIGVERSLVREQVARRPVIFPSFTASSPRMW